MPNIAVYVCVFVGASSLSAPLEEPPATPQPSPGQTRLTPFREQLWRDRALKDLTIDGYRYTVSDSGRGSPVVLLHGLGGSLYDWRHLLKDLAREHRVIAPDLLGAGESDKPESGDYSLTAQARRVKGLLDLLGVERPTLVGNSYGGGVALVFAQFWPQRVEKLVLINSVCYAENIPTYAGLCKVPWSEYASHVLPLEDTTRWILRSCYHDPARLSDGEIAAYVTELGAPGRRESVVLTVRALIPQDLTEFEARLKSVTIPALLLWGKHDDTIPIALAGRLAKDLPDARLVELDAGHVPNQERPAEVLTWLIEFLKQKP